VIWFNGGAARRITAIGSDTSMTVESSLAQTGTTYRRGGRAPNTHYFYYEATDITGGTAGGFLTTRSERSGDTVVNLPNAWATAIGGKKKYRQKRFAIRLDGSSNIIPFLVAMGWPNRPFIRYNVALSAFIGQFVTITAGTTQVLSAGTATSYTDIDLSAFVPKISQEAMLATIAGAGSAGFTLRPNGQTHTGWQVGNGASGGVFNQNFVGTDSSQIIEYKRETGTGGMTVDVVGYVVDRF